MTLIFGSLFSGIGGIDLGFERAGMICSWQVEIDDYCNKVLAKHWPDVRRYRDVKEVHGVVAHAKHAGQHEAKGQQKITKVEQRERRTEKPQSVEQFEGSSTRRLLYKPRCPYCLPPVDVITGGFPCQPHSVAGKRRGADDDRNLWPEYLRIITELRPAWVVGENVPGIVTTYLDTVLSDLEGAGYEVATFNLPAVAFDAPHRRERIFVVAYSNVKGLAQRESEPSNNGTKQQAIVEGGSIRDVAHAENSNDAKSRNKERGTPPQLGNICGRNGTTANYWPTEPSVGRVAHGVSNRVDRLRGLGNAVVPAVAEFVGKQILAANSP